MNSTAISYKSQLHIAMTAKFVRTKRTWTWLLLLAFILFALTAVSAVADTPRVAPILNGLGILCGIGVVSLRIHAQGLYGQAEALRRAYFQLEGSGIRRRSGLDADLHKTVRAVDMGIIIPDRKYYGSSLLPGPDRLADNLEESALYTRALAGKTWKLCMAVFAVGVLVVFSLLYWAAILGPHGVGLLALAPHVLNFIGLGFALDLGVSFFRLERSAAQTLDQVAMLRSDAGMRLEDLLPAITDYDCALAATGAPIPDFLYGAREAELDTVWQRLCATRNVGAIGVAIVVPTEQPNTAPRGMLVEFLANRFDNDEFRDFVRVLESGCFEACLVDSGTRHETVVSDFVATLTRRGFIDTSFFQALELARPRHASEVQKLARLWPSAKGPHD